MEVVLKTVSFTRDTRVWTRRLVPARVILFRKLLAREVARELRKATPRNLSPNPRRIAMRILKGRDYGPAARAWVTRGSKDLRKPVRIVNRAFYSAFIVTGTRASTNTRVPPRHRKSGRTIKSFHPKSTRANDFVTPVLRRLPAMSRRALNKMGAA